MNADDFRRIALAMEGAIESAHMGHPDFRANGRIFATLHHDHQTGMVKLTPDQQQTFLRDHPRAFAPEAGAWGRSEEHTSELQSQSNLVCRLLLEKKKKNKTTAHAYGTH